MRSSAIIIYVFSSFGFRTQRIRATFAPFVAPLQVVCCLGQTLDAEMRAQRASSPIKVVYDIDTSGDRNLWHLDNMLLGYHSNVLSHCTEFRNFFVCGLMCPCPFVLWPSASLIRPNRIASVCVEPRKLSYQQVLECVGFGMNSCSMLVCPRGMIVWARLLSSKNRILGDLASLASVFTRRGSRMCLVSCLPFLVGSTSEAYEASCNFYKFWFRS